jgi:hypothetical protein
MEIINRIYEESLRNIEDGTYELYGSTEAYKRKDEVSYNGSVFKIWRSVKSFYDEDYIINGVKKDV